MPWSLDRRDGRWCVIKDSDGSTAGCHDSRADAIKQQRALYANESRVAAMYAELDAQPVVMEASEEFLDGVKVVESKPNSELVKIEIGKEHEAVTASLLERMDAMSQREALTTEALVAALEAIGAREPVVNVHPPTVNVEQPAITVEQPDITMPDIHVAAPEVHPVIELNPQLVMPSMPTKKTVVFDRDYDGRLNSAEITEE